MACNIVSVPCRLRVELSASRLGPRRSFSSCKSTSIVFRSNPWTLSPRYFYPIRNSLDQGPPLPSDHSIFLPDPMGTATPTTTPSPSPGSSAAGTKRKRNTAGKYYAVKKGYQPGVYYSWNDCLAQVTGYKGAVCGCTYNSHRKSHANGRFLI